MLRFWSNMLVQDVSSPKLCSRQTHLGRDTSSLQVPTHLRIGSKFRSDLLYGQSGKQVHQNLLNNFVRDAVGAVEFLIPGLEALARGESVATALTEAKRKGKQPAAYSPGPVHKGAQDALTAALGRLGLRYEPSQGGALSVPLPDTKDYSGVGYTDAGGIISFASWWRGSAPKELLGELIAYALVINDNITGVLRVNLDDGRIHYATTLNARKAEQSLTAEFIANMIESNVQLSKLVLGGVKRILEGQSGVQALRDSAREYFDPGIPGVANPASSMLAYWGLADE
jgi:hypothetical protein